MSFWNEQQKKPISFYEILNVSPQASDEDIKKAYRAMAIKFHPDRNPESKNIAAHRFQLITEAYSRIKTPQQRAHYNQWLKNQPRTYKTAANSNKTSWFQNLFRPAQKGSNL